jgi:hypothetical protein
VNIVLPFPPSELSAHANGNSFRGKSAITKEWRSLAWATALQADLPAFPAGSPYTPDGDIHLTVRFYPPNKRGDRTNFPNRCKPIFDGLADALSVNDARFVPHFEFHAPSAPGRVEISLATKEK